MTKRDMFSELMRGIGDLKSSGKEKLTLRTTVVVEKSRFQISAEADDPSPF